MRKISNQWAVKAASFMALGVVATGVALGQAIASARVGAEIAPFTTITMLSPDWGPKNNLGVTAGVDYTHFIRAIVQPSLELRMTHASGGTVGENTFSGGMRLQGTVRKIHPYMTLLAGYGTINFTPEEGNYKSDNSMVYSLGGGADFDIRSGVKMRVDFSRQHWNLQPLVLTPTTLSVGFSYAIPFGYGRRGL